MLVSKKQKAGARVEHLLLVLLKAGAIQLENNDWIERNFGKRGLSSSVHWQRAQALEELFLCLRSHDLLIVCDDCDILFPRSQAYYQVFTDRHFCLSCEKNIEEEDQFVLELAEGAHRS